MRFKTSEAMVAYLKKHSEEIGEKSLAGHPTATKVVRLYIFYTQCPRPAQAALLDDAIVEYEEHKDDPLPLFAWWEKQSELRFPVSWLRELRETVDKKDYWIFSSLGEMNCT